MIKPITGLIVVLGMLALLTGLPEHHAAKHAAPPPPVVKGQLMSAARATLVFKADRSVGTWKCRTGTNVCTLTLPR